MTLVDQPAGRQNAFGIWLPILHIVLTNDHIEIMIHVIQRQPQQNHFLNLRGHNAQLIALCFQTFQQLDRSVHRLNQIGVRGAVVLAVFFDQLLGILLWEILRKHRLQRRPQHRQLFIAGEFFFCSVLFKQFAVAL